MSIVKKSEDAMSNEPDYAGALKRRRTDLGLTQQGVAKRAGIPLQSYQQFESGKRSITRASFSIACRVLTSLAMDPYMFYHNYNYYFKDNK